jgi:hypothetical protein
MTVSTSIRWPTAVTLRRTPLRATIARMIFENAVRRVPVRVSYPDGRVLGAGSPVSPEFAVVRPAAFFARLGRDAKIGFGEAYMAGDWRAGSGTDLADLLTSFASRLTTLIPPALQRLRVLVDRRVPHDHENTPDGARTNIAAHYDLSNDLFAAFLDPTMTYSCAWFDNSEPIAAATRLEEAQLRKIDGILDLAGVQAGTRVLEIGSGWGSLAIRAAQRGAHVTTITLSHEQMRLARERVEAPSVVSPGIHRAIRGEATELRLRPDRLGRVDRVLVVHRRHDGLRVEAFAVVERDEQGIRRSVPLEPVHPVAHHSGLAGPVAGRHPVVPRRTGIPCLRQDRAVGVQHRHVARVAELLEGSGLRVARVGEQAEGLVGVGRDDDAVHAGNLPSDVPDLDAILVSGDVGDGMGCAYVLEQPGEPLDIDP